MGTDVSFTTATGTSSSRASTLPSLKPQHLARRERRESKAPTSYLVLEDG